MANFQINISKLNKRITIEVIDGTNTSKNGFDIPNWKPYKTIWASVNNLFGNEFYAAKAVNAENTVEFIVRYSKDLEKINSKDNRIIWNDKKFNITFVDNIGYENKWLKIKAVEVV